MHHLRRMAALGCVLTAALIADRKPVTLDDAIQPAPTPPSVAWTRDGKRFAYVESGRIFLYDVSQRAGRELLPMASIEEKATRATAPETFDWENRRVREHPVQWMPSGDRLLVIAAGDLFLVDAASGAIRQITSTNIAERDAKPSPDGRYLSFRRDNDLYTLELSKNEVHRLTRDGSSTLWNARLDWVYPEELEIGTAHFWSPDSSRIAYMQFDVSKQNQYPHADLLKIRAVYEPQLYPKAGTPNATVRIGVVSAGGGRTRWMEFGPAEDALFARLHWLPDSRSVAVERLNRIQNKLDFVIADAASGSSRILFSESDPHWLNVDDHARYLARSGDLLWYSESTGYRHLYRVLPSGERKQITSGDWEVTSVAGVDEEAGWLYYVSTEASPLERHLYRIKPDGSGKEKLTSAAGKHTVSMSPDSAHFLDTYSSLMLAPITELFSTAGERLAVVRDRSAKLEEFELLPTEIVPVKAGDGATLHARLIKPAVLEPGRKYPAIVMVYGGPHAQAVQNSWAGPSWEQLLARKGFVIWQLDNRGSAGRGHAWETKLFRRFGHQELEDQKAGVRHLLSLGFVDPPRVGMHGWSYGGFMTLYSLFHAPDIFRAGVAGAPVTDWRNYDTIYTERYLGLPAQNEEGYKLSSPVHYAANLKGKLMLVHNTEDDNVLLQHTMQMSDALQRAGKHFELLLYQQKTHGVTGSYRRHLLEATINFFERELKR